MGYVIVALCVVGIFQAIAMDSLRSRVSDLERRFYRDLPP